MTDCPLIVKGRFIADVKGIFRRYLAPCVSSSRGEFSFVYIYSSALLLLRWKNSNPKSSHTSKRWLFDNPNLFYIGDSEEHLLRIDYSRSDGARATTLKNERLLPNERDVNKICRYNSLNVKVHWLSTGRGNPIRLKLRSRENDYGLITRAARSICTAGSLSRVLSQKAASPPSLVALARSIGGSKLRRSTEYTRGFPEVYTHTHTASCAPG